VEVCPEDAIRMDTGRLDIAEYSRERMIYDKKRLMEE
jgi:formate hydrogenlyase subunit 6/NADH:ubiquinone oxidoreductase subunit I